MCTYICVCINIYVYTFSLHKQKHTTQWTLSLKKSHAFGGHGSQHVGCYFPDQGWNHCALHLKCGVLTTCPPGKSLNLDFSHNYFFQDFFQMWTILKVFVEFVTTLLLFYVFWIFWSRGLGDLNCLTRGQTHTPCIGRWSLNHWTAREFPHMNFHIMKVDLITHINLTQATLKSPLKRWTIF